MQPATKKLIAELGLRYRPARSADLEAHAAALALLARDLADVQPALLARAIDRWVRLQGFMPKASELIALARTNDASVGRVLSAAELAAQMNQRLAIEGNPRGLRWVADGMDLRLSTE